VQANEQLGFGEDERTYEYVPYILQVRFSALALS
jgi:GTP cyclohydrolase II